MTMFLRLFAIFAFPLKCIEINTIFTAMHKL